MRWKAVRQSAYLYSVYLCAYVTKYEIGTHTIRIETVLNGTEMR